MAYLNLASIRMRTESEGPGKRFAIWVQGCKKRCPGCCNPDMQEIRKNIIVDTSDLIELGKKLTKEHPELGSKGNMAIYFTGAVSDGRAALMLVNKTDVDIKKDLEFSLSWSYDGKTIFDNQKISYTIKDSGELPSYTTTLILLPLNSEQMESVDSMSDPSKMTLSISDVKSVE